jgi:hypothetical protein
MQIMYRIVDARRNRGHRFQNVDTSTIHKPQRLFTSECLANLLKDVDLLGLLLFMKLLELFAGSRSVGRVAEQMGMDVYSLDIHPFDGINLAKDILDVTVADIPFVPDVIWASPPCTFFSVASIGHHWYKDHTPKTENAVLGVQIVQKTLDLVNFFLERNADLHYFIENPRGKLRKLPVMANLPLVTVMYCQYGDTRMKPTDIWSNNIADIFNPQGWNPRPECWNGNTACHHEPAPRGSRTGTQGLTGSYERSKIPTKLVEEILESV